MKQRVVLFIISFLSTAIAFTQGTTEVAATTAAPVKPGFSLQDLTIIATMLLVFIVSFLIIYQLIVMRNQMNLHGWRNSLKNLLVLNQWKWKAN
jgi:hypothetical protein